MLLQRPLRAIALLSICTWYLRLSICRSLPLLRHLPQQKCYTITTSCEVNPTALSGTTKKCKSILRSCMAASSANNEH